MKTCKICNKNKELSDFYKSGETYMARCKDCQRAYGRKWAELNKLKMLETREKFGKDQYRTKLRKNNENGLHA